MCKYERKRRIMSRAQRGQPHKKFSFFFLVYLFCLVGRYPERSEASLTKNIIFFGLLLGRYTFDRFRMGTIGIWGFGRTLEFGCTHGGKWGVQYHSCIPCVGVLGTRAGPGILPDILTEACMNDLAYPILYWDWNVGVCE